MHDTGGVLLGSESYHDGYPHMDQILASVKGPGPFGNLHLHDPNDSYDDNQWHWVGLRVQSLELTVWIDGQLKDIGTYGDGTTMTDSGTRVTRFGRHHGDVSLDDYKVWDEALSDTAMYNDYIGFTPPPENCSQAIAEGYGLATDLNADCYVNWADFSIFAADWLRCMDPGNVDCEKPWE